MMPGPDDDQSAPATAPNGEEPSDDGPFDPFDPEALRVSGIGDADVVQVLITVPVRKPKPREFFRVHPDPAYVLDTVVLERETGTDKESYIVAPSLRQELTQELRQVRLFTVMTKAGTVLLWPVRLPGDGAAFLRRISDSALQVAEQAKTAWVRTMWNRDLGAYDLKLAVSDHGCPQWPDKTFRDLIKIAFRDNLIDRLDHPVIRELNGE